MKFFTNLSLRSKLILASLIPVAGLVYYLQTMLKQDFARKDSAEVVIDDVTRIREMSLVLHEIQKERAFTLGFMNSNDPQLMRSLTEQHQATDASISRLAKVHLRQGRRTSVMFDSLLTTRDKVRRHRRIEEIDDVYLDLKFELLTDIASIVSKTENSMLQNRMEQHLCILRAKDYLASIRSVLGVMIASREDSAYGHFASLKGVHEFNLKRLREIASPDLVQFYQKKYEGPFIRQTYEVMQSAFDDFSKLQSSFENWSGLSTSTINTLKEIEDYSSEQILITANEIVEEASAKVFQGIISATILILVIVGLVAFTIRDIVNAIDKLKVAAEKMATGDTSSDVAVSGRDELGELALSFNKMIGATREFAVVADAIGKGNYQQDVETRGTFDTLGIALHQMKANLMRLSKENETRTWLLAGSAKVNDTLRGEKDVKLLAQDVITLLATYLRAKVATIYLNEAGRLNLVGSYAFQARKNNANSFTVGEGLIGQAALERKTIVFSEIPEDYISIVSGLGNINPKNIILFPFIYENEVKGVLELGLPGELSELDLQFLEMIGNNVAIAFNAAQSREKTKELLEETQRQAEELEVQQEELKQSNEELQEKTSLLEKSEAELKAQQEELQQTNEELEEKANLLEEQKERLEVAKMEIENKARELEATSKYKSEFLANMSHELRTPLNSILILSQLLSENKQNTLGEKEVDFVRNIHSSGTDLLNLINEILDLSKVESGKMEMDISDVPFQEIIADMNAMFSQIATTKAIDFDINIEEELRNASLKSDPQRLKQIIRNLLSNAFKFTENKGRIGLTIKHSTFPGETRKENATGNSEAVAFIVSDTGIGVPIEKQSLIFAAFQQAEGSTKRKYGGTGLGLSISRELARALGGEIYLNSEQGKGSEFTLMLPLQSGSIQKRHLPPAKKINDQKRLQTEPTPLPTDLDSFDDRASISENDRVVLIIEDDVPFSKLLLDFVHERSYKGVVAHQGNTGLSYARYYKPDAVLLDMKLPVMDGVEVLKHLKHDPQLRHIPVQIISSYDMRKEGIEMGAFDFVKKPVTTDTLQRSFTKIENFINRKLRRLLIVEDNELQNKAIRELIGNGDVKCSSAYSGTQALDALRQEKFDCIILDLGLPDMIGFELLQKIKKDDSINGIPIVVYTGKDLSKEEASALNRLANTVVLKTANSFERLLDETTLFLHRVESKLPDEKQNILRKLHKTDEILKNKTVLVVDDDVRNTYSLTNALIEEGLNCLVAENGKAAIQVLNEHNNIDMVLMDVMMPEMDGYEATIEIRKIQKFAKLPVIALTAKAMKGDREKCLASGMSDYVSKPVNVPQLLSLMRVWLYK
jgi:CheY-like chemotaxis protein/signal transduction histidine kinase/HAMP domain-containing protein